MEETLAWKRIEHIVRQRHTKHTKPTEIRIEKIPDASLQESKKHEKGSLELGDTEEVNSGDTGEMPVVCRKYNARTTAYSGCGGVGHIFRFCPHNQCRMCSNYGHIHTDCPYAPHPKINLWEEISFTPCFVSEN